MNEQFDFVAIGDVVIDAFIKLNVGHTEETAKGTELCIPYGAKIPYEEVVVIPAVGNSANAAVSAARIGLKSALLSFVGKDKYGEECIERLQKEGVDTRFIQVEEGKTTNYHYVLWFKEDRTILIKHEAFTPVLPDLGAPKWIYLSSIGEHAKSLHFTLAEYLEKNPSINLAFQPGTFQLKLKKELLPMYKVTKALCLNKEEAQDLLENEDHDIKTLLDGVMSWGPKIVMITDGPHGAYLKYENTYLFMPPYPDIAPPYERTGAGDAFFSTFISYLAKGYDEAYAIKRAPINSMNVVQHIGAQEGLLSDEKIEEFLKNAPTEYQLKILE